MKVSSKVKMLAMAGVLAVVGVASLGARPTYAADVNPTSCKCQSGTDGKYNGKIDESAAYTEPSKNTCRMYCGTVNGQTADTATNDKKLSDTVKTILQIVIGLVGVLAVIMIIYGGVQYTTSAGDTGKVTKAKNTILYGIIGLVISLLAFAIVTWVLGNVG